ncbi:29835_t:CDS:1, partial [Racocetra persica]
VVINTPIGKVATGARIQIGWDITGQSSGLFGSLHIQNRDTGESTTINDQVDLTLRRLQWKVSVPPGTYVFTINDGTGEKFSGEFQVAQGIPVGSSDKASDVTKKEVDNDKAMTHGNSKSVGPTSSQDSSKSQAPMSSASTTKVAS